MGTFEFVRIASLRAAQLSRGCRPRVEGDHTVAVFAQMEVAEGKVTRAVPEIIAPVNDAPVSISAEAVPH
jgi:DNA-directed RNA polymerase subunit K/omega